MLKMLNRYGLKPRARIGNVIFVGVLVLGVLGAWVWQRSTFPTTNKYRQLIRTADHVEIRAFLVGHVENGHDVAVLNTPGDLADLADSLRITGPWLPLDELTANSYRLRIVNGGRATDIVIRGGDRIRTGTVWHAALSPSLVDTIRSLVHKNGGEMPDWTRLTGGNEGPPRE